MLWFNVLVPCHRLDIRLHKILVRVYKVSPPYVLREHFESNLLINRSSYNVSINSKLPVTARMFFLLQEFFLLH
jgi:hypothetical protein